MTGAVAAIDCGTNSTRLLVADGEGRTQDREMRITRLGEGVDQTHRLAPAAIQRTVAVLEEYRQVMDRHRVLNVRMTATSAVRDASNGQEYLDAARKAVGVDAEILTGDEEGSLSYAGATADLTPESGGWLVVDVGGGSTELAAGKASRPDAVRSLDIGCVRVTERFLKHDPPTASEVDEAKKEIHRLLDDAAAKQPAFGAQRTFVGLAGTVAALASLDQRLEHYDRDRLHHYRLTKEAITEMTRALAAEPSAARVRRPGMEKGRADVIAGGALIVEAVMSHFGFDACLTSESDILDGLVASLL